MNPGLKIGEIAEKLPLVEVAKVVVRLVTTAGGNQRRKRGGVITSRAEARRR
jgi:hypothetical protein